MLESIVIFLGILSAYNVTPTDATVNYYQEHEMLPLDLSQYDVLLAVDDCSLIGHEATMWANFEEFSAIIFDCAGKDGAKYFSDGGSLGTPWLLAADADGHFWKRRPDIVRTLVYIEVDR